MKIGIITVHKSDVNYGASLQCYALWKFVSKLGYTCEVIDLLRPCHDAYIPGRNETIRTRQKSNFVKRLISNLLNFSNNRHKDRKKKAFSLFNSKISYSLQYKSVTSIYENPPKYDVYISGSDQIWNPQMPFENEPYLLGFVNNRGRKVAYASSFGVSAIDYKHYDCYANLLSSYNYISVREESGADIVYDIIKKKPEVVLDPIFLLTADDWRKESVKPINVDVKPYIFVYLLSYNKVTISYALCLAKDKGIDLYVIIADNKPLPEKGLVQIFDSGPSEWLWLIDNATHVLTNSFHGTAFSVLFGTPFCVYQKVGVSSNTRVSTILKRFGLENHIVLYSDNSSVETAVFEYDVLRKDVLLQSARQESISYLTKAISDDKNK